MKRFHCSQSAPKILWLIVHAWSLLW